VILQGVFFYHLHFTQNPEIKKTAPTTNYHLPK